MDIDTGEIVKTVNTLVGENQELRRQVKSLAKQNMRQVRSMRAAVRTMEKILTNIEQETVIFMNDDPRGFNHPEVLSDHNTTLRMRDLVQFSVNKLNNATTGTL